MSEFLFDRPRPDLLETFPNPRPGRDYEITHVAPEFTSVCPKTGHPDFGTLTLRYVPTAACVELKSLKLYYQSFRNHGAFYEAVTNEIADVLIDLLAPKELELLAEWTPRGGLRSVIRVGHEASEGASAPRAGDGRNPEGTGD